MRVFKRTEGVSTTNITARLLSICDGDEQKEENKAPPVQKFLQTTWRINNFSNHRAPTKDDTIVYIQGSWDILHHGHLRRLELAKQQGTFLYVGIWDDEMTRYYKGSAYPVVSLQERVLMTLACKHVDEVVIGAPYVITKDLIQCLNIKKVIHIVDTAEDTPKKEFADVDQFSEVREILKDGFV